MNKKLNNFKKRFVTLGLTAVLSLSSLGLVFADGARVVTLGANLTQEQKDTMLKYFGVNKDEVVDNDNPVVEKDDNKKDEDNKKEEEKKEIITATNYDYEKLDGYQYVIKSNRLNVTNKSMDFVAALQNMPTTTYSVLEPQLETLKQRFVSTGYIVNNAYSKTYGSTKFLVFEMTYMGQNLILFYAEHPDKTTICGSIQLKSSSYTNEDALRDMSIIINASEKSTETNDESSESFNSDISDIF